MRACLWFHCTASLHRRRAGGSQFLAYSQRHQKTPLECIIFGSPDSRKGVEFETSPSVNALLGPGVSRRVGASPHAPATTLKTRRSSPVAGHRAVCRPDRTCLVSSRDSHSQSFVSNTNVNRRL